MSKYVCDFEEVRSIAQQIKTNKENMSNNLNSYQTDVDNALKDWTGPAKDNFNNSNSEQITKIGNNINQIESVSNFIIEVVNAIESTEEELASLNI